MPPRQRAGRQSRGDARSGGRGRNGGDRNSRGGSGGREDRRPNGGAGSRRERAEETSEEKAAKASYHSWRRLIKDLPLRNDIRTTEKLWNGALEILSGDNPEWKQRLIFDLESDEYHGRAHIKNLMEMQTGSGGSSTFVRLGKPFLLVITHQALLDCLAVDTAVGGIFNFISGSHGSRAMPFFQDFCKNLLNNHLNSASAVNGSVEQLLIALPKAIHELLIRENRASFNEDLPSLLNSIEEMLEVILVDKHSVTFKYVGNKVEELRRLVARSQGLLHEEESTVKGITTGVVMSTYPRAIEIPQGRHDNDKADISEIKIIPTEEEIRSSLPEYLPSTNLDIPHFLDDQAQRHLDTHFRLLRHDIFGELKEALGGLILAAEQNALLLENPRLNLSNIRAYSYPMTVVHELSFNHRRGLEVQLSFPHPEAVRNRTKTQRRRWWEDSKRLQEGVFLCLLSFEDGNNSLLFLNVSGKVTNPEEAASLSFDDHFATIMAKLASNNHRDVATTVRLCCQKTPGILIELPGIILATFVPVLESIQDMYRLCRLPFRQWIIPDRLENQGNNPLPLDIPPPTYARNRSFTFSLKAVLKEGAEDILICPMETPSPNDNIVDKVEAQTTLDRGQCEALVSALSHEFVQIQGPPGTGKSYLGVNLMRVLLSSAATAKLGPIIVVCYTNHALDQFLEHLLDVGVQKLVRVGGQSKSSRLEGMNLREIAREEGKSKLEGYICATTYQELEQQEESMEAILDSIHSTRRKPSWTMLKDHLEGKYSTIHSQFNRIDQDGYQAVGRDPFDIWLSDREVHDEMDFEDNTIKQLLEIADNSGLNNISPFDRTRLTEHWVSEIRKDLSDDLYETMKTTEGLRQKLSDVHDEVDLRVLSKAEVIGVTTTGLAKRIKALQHVPCKIVICEEAGEITEPHFLNALLPTVEHMISIGDHQQLRPQINNFSLSLESQTGAPYQLDRSQFERLSVGESGRPPFPVSQLNVQRRMRPQISNLIRATIYPRLVDHESTHQLPDVVGMRHNVFFLDHNNLQDGGSNDKQQKSHSNSWEVDMTFALVRHIVRQGVYKSADIAVLTPYTGQLQSLRAKFQSEFEIVLSDRDEEALLKEGFVDTEVGASDNQASQVVKKPLAKKQMSELLRLATVDNFQGEEAKIVIVSLVRSNKEKKVGFLRTSNRINVLLSRAQHGLYLIGNAETYANVPMWNEVLGLLRADEAVGKQFSLCCPRHPGTEIEASQSEDFARRSPEGGCQLICNQRLNDCGHQCLAQCHSDSMHRVFACPKPCERLHSPCSHPCQKSTCGEDCERCMVKIDGMNLLCGHVENGVHCYLTQEVARIACSTVVEKVVPGCNHTVSIRCSEDITSQAFMCPYPCDAILQCGHPCPGSCGRCNRKDKAGRPFVRHNMCLKICGRSFGTCNHTCPRTCHDGSDCGTCSSSCEFQCAHSKCARSCNEACSPCIERCTWACEHQGACNLPCAAPCSRLPCNKRCNNLLICDHQCPSIYGESCPEEYCQICSTKQDDRVDLLEMKTYNEIDLDETPIVVLGCGHFFTAETIDGMIGMSEAYNIDGYGEFTGLKDTSSELSKAIPRCPDCNSAIRQHITQRYNRVINRAVIDEMSKRFIVSGQKGLRKLELQIEELDQKLESSRSKILGLLDRASKHRTQALTPGAQAEMKKLLFDNNMIAISATSDVTYFRRSTLDRNQPAQKLHDATIYAARQAATLDGGMAGLTITPSIPKPARDRRVTLGGFAADLKCRSIILSHLFAIAQALNSNTAGAAVKKVGGNPSQQYSSFLQDCRTLIEDCKQASLPKPSVEVACYFGKVARALQMYSHATNSDIEKATSVVQEAITLLETAKDLCKQPFKDAVVLSKAIDNILGLLGKEWYEEVTAEELAAIKQAMVSGHGGIATHSGHWYNCENGHPFAIGECGMPMEQARCIECGAGIGGQNHSAVEGVTRADQMER